MNSESETRLTSAPADVAGVKSDSSPFNINAAMDRVAGNMDLLKELAALFVSSCSQSLANVGQALADGDAEKLISSAHSLKGSVSNFTAERAFQAAQKVEHSARDGDLGGAQEAFATLSLEIGLLKSALEQLV